MPNTAQATLSQATGPNTPQGKAIASRNATTHGLFARDIVLPSLGEDPDGYRKMEAEWMTQLAPRNLLERHYVEKIAAASWRLRRLHRWQAQLFEDTAITEDERLDRLDKVLRHETALHRQIDTAVKMLNKDVPQLYASRARDQVLGRKPVVRARMPGKPARRVGSGVGNAGPSATHPLCDSAGGGNLSRAPLDTEQPEETDKTSEADNAENCENELPAVCPPGYVRTEDKWIVRPADDFLPAPDGTRTAALPPHLSLTGKGRDLSRG